MTSTITPRVAICDITFSDDTKVELSPSDVVLVVGPNNAGKSATLRAIRDKLSSAEYRSPVLNELHINRTGDVDSLNEWLSTWASKDNASNSGNPSFQSLGHSINRHQANHDWQHGGHSLNQLTRWFCHLLSADERLQICNPPSSIAITQENPNHPIHFLLRDDTLELKLSGKFHKAFGIDLVVHRNAGSQVPLHVGQRPIPSNGEDRVSIGYIQELEKLPTLHSQGDGMRSFAGVLLATSVGRESIILIDEPEAFLHPSQARLLGTTLVQDKGADRQLFIATHSSDILRGALDANSSDIRVLRVQRDGAKNNVRLLNNDRIKELWNDPLLRYSNILDGLFHEGVVVCEGDADCRFYAAVLNAVLATKDENTKRPDIMFTHCGGKSRLSVVARALREVGVPVKVVADFDVLSEEQPLRSIAESLWMSWADISADWETVKQAVDAKKPDLNTQEVRSQIEAILSGIASNIFPQKAKGDIQSILKRSSPWSAAKLAGKTYIPPGEPTKACDRLLAKLRAGGLHVVHVGEVEGFVRSEGGHGPSWVNAVLALDLVSNPELDEARKFVLDLVRVR